MVQITEVADYGNGDNVTLVTYKPATSCRKESLERWVLHTENHFKGA